MIRILDWETIRPEEILNRDIRAEADVEATVDAIIADVRARGDEALKEYARRFGPLTIDTANDAASQSWQWIQTKWPWEGGAC